MKEYNVENIKNEICSLLGPLVIKNLDIYCREVLDLNKFEWSGNFVYNNEAVEFKLSKFLNGKIAEKRIAWQIAYYIAIKKLNISATDPKLNELFKAVPKA